MREVYQSDIGQGSIIKCLTGSDGEKEECNKTFTYSLDSLLEITTTEVKGVKTNGDHYFEEKIRYSRDCGY